MDFPDAPAGALILGTAGIVIQAVWITIFLRRVFERDRAGEDAPEELHGAVTGMLWFAPVGWVLFFVALFWWSTSR